LDAGIPKAAGSGYAREPLGGLGNKSSPGKREW